MTPKRKPPAAARGPDERRDEILPCVWMLAGMLSYRLCDRGYECESCPLDAALQGTAAPPAKGARTPRWEFPADRLYHPRHGWLQPLGGRRVRVGLDALASRLLDRLSAAILPAVGAHLEHGGAIGWFADEGDLIPVRAAVPGIVERVNRRVQSDPALIAGAPYAEGWLLELRCAVPPESVPHLMSAEQAERRAAQQLARLCKETRLVPEADADVGPTMADGGQPAALLREAVGVQRYHGLIVALFG